MTRKCPKCSYCSPSHFAACGICGAPLDGVSPAETAPLERKNPGPQLAAGLLLLFAGAYLFFSSRPPAPPAQGAEPDGFSYGGVLYSLEAMRDLRFVSAADKRKVLPLLRSEDDKAGHAAAELLGAWARFSPEPALREDLFAALLDCSASCRAAARRQAALEAGMTAAFGFPLGRYARQASASAEALAREGDETMNAAGFFLASMCGVRGLVPQMRQALGAAPSRYLKLHAACALSRLGYDEGHDYLFSLIPSVSDEDAAEAVACLSYSASPRAGEFLRRAASGAYGPGKAGAAGVSLSLRARLAPAAR